MIVLIGHQITSFAYPGVDMIGQMGLAHGQQHQADDEALVLCHYTRAQ